VTIAVRDLIAVGSIVKAFGIKGDVIVEPLTDMPERFRSLRHVYLASESSATGVNDSEPVTAEVTAVQIEPRGIRVKFSCAPDRTAAERLVGLLVMIPPEDIVSLPPGTFFVHQLIGFAAVDEQGAHLGTLKDVLHLPAHDVYVIGAEGKEDLLVPAVREFVRRIDTATRTMMIRVIEGMRL
jgi:16S rRNA processing protein RimM